MTSKTSFLRLRLNTSYGTVQENHKILYLLGIVSLTSAGRDELFEIFVKLIQRDSSMEFK